MTRSLSLLIRLALIATSVTAAAGQRGPSIAGPGVPTSLFRGPSSRAIVPFVEGPGSITGWVLDRETKMPIAGASVEVTQVGGLVPQGTPGGRPVTGQGTLLSDAQGQFHLEHIALGHYSLYASAPGYANPGGAMQYQSGGPNTELTTDHPSSSVTFRFSRAGAFDGTVRDEKGRPLGNITVRLYRRTVIWPLMCFQAIPFAAVTDATGTYRFSDVPAGDYIVSVFYRSVTIPRSVALDYRLAQQTASEAQRFLARLQDSGAPIPTLTPGQVASDAASHTLTVEDLSHRAPPASSAADATIRVYRTTYHPATTSFTDAEVISMQPGEHRAGVDVTLRAAPAVRVSGTLTGDPAKVGDIGVRLVPVATENIYRTYTTEAAASVTDASGRFTFLGVGEGDYMLEATVTPSEAAGATSPGRNANPGAALMPAPHVLESFARERVTVGRADVTDLSVPLRIPLTVRGRVEYERPDGAAVPPMPISGQTRVALELVVPGAAPAPSTTAMADGQFTLSRAIAGRYILAASPPTSWMVKSITQGGRSVMDRAIAIDHDLTDVVVTMTSAIGHVSGAVRDSTGEAVAGAQVLLFPVDFRTWLNDGMPTRPMRNVRTDAGGGFSLWNLTTGDYLVAAFADDDGITWPEPHFVASAAAAATMVHVDEGRAAFLTLSPAKIR